MKKIFLILFLIFGGVVYGQVEMVPVGHSVYRFLKRMQLEGFIPEYNSASLPISRGEVGELLRAVQSSEFRVMSFKSGDEVMKESDEVMKERESSSEFRVMSFKSSDEVMKSGDEVMKERESSSEFRVQKSEEQLGVHPPRRTHRTRSSELRVKNSEQKIVDSGSLSVDGSQVKKEKRIEEETEKKIEKRKMSGTDRKILGDFLVEFGYDINKDMKRGTVLMKGGNVFDDTREKFFYAYTDSNAAVFLDGFGAYYQLAGKGDSLGNHFLPLGELGFRLRGTLFGAVGFYLKASNGQKLGGTVSDVDFGALMDPRLRANTKFFYEKKNFDLFEGYLRYETPSRWLAMTVGREYLNQGFGYIDKMFLGSNSAPFDFLKLDLGYKAFKYSFTYGSLKGDSLGRDLEWKSIATHRLDVKATKWMRFGLTESIIFTNTPFSFTYLNPVSFLISADLNTGSSEYMKNNSVLGADFEIIPFKNFAFQGTLLVDDLNFSTISNDDYTANDNKFGYQAGLLWNDAFTVPSMSFALEYTRLDPFVYSHRTNKSQYTNWQLPLAHNLPPNSDEIAGKIDFNVTNRLRVFFQYQHQRSGEGFVFDSTGAVIINYGGNINVGGVTSGNNNILIKDKFLQGNRVEREIFTVGFNFEPVRQYYINFQYQYKVQNLFYAGSRVGDSVFWLRVSVGS